MKLRNFAFLLLILMQPLAFAQSVKGLIFDKTTVDFGTVDNWDNPPAVFQFENTTFGPMFILAPKFSRNVLVEYPRNRIESGEKGQVKVFFYTDKKGAFSENITLYYSSSDKPVILTIKGNIKNIAIDALTECPTFGAPPKKATIPLYAFDGLVVNKITQEPIPNAKVTIVGMESFYASRRGEFKEKVQAGMNLAVVSAQGYRTLNKSFAVGPNGGSVKFELIPLQDVPREQLEENEIETPQDTTPVEEPFVMQETRVEEIPPVEGETGDFSFREFRANNIVLLIDVSASMKRNGKMESLKSALYKMVDVMRAVDYVSMITFATTTNQILVKVEGTNKTAMNAAVDKLVPAGTTNGVVGLEAAYTLVFENFIPEGNNQVILATDGMFRTDQATLAQIEEYKKKGVKLSVVGFGDDERGKPAMQKLANTGGGNFIEFDNSPEVNSLLIQELKKNSKR